MRSWIQWALMGAVSVSAGVVVVRESTAESSGTTRPAGASPVVVELFTSEGCSSCPAADALLRDLDRRGSVDGREVLVLGFHVDYWNGLGWPDAYSSAQFTARQRDYAVAFGSSSVYTPQAVVNGAREFVASDANAMQEAIRAARDVSRVDLNMRVSGDEVTLEAVSKVEGRLMLAVTESGLSTRVRRGENAGRELEHAPTVRVLRNLGRVGEGSTSMKTVVSLEAGWKRENLRFVALVQDEKSGRIRSVGWAGIPR